MRTLLFVALTGLAACADATAPVPATCTPGVVAPARFLRGTDTISNRFTRPLRNADTILSAPSSVGVVRIITWKSNGACQTLLDSLAHRMVKVSAL
jgi:hypothetical protein